MTTSICLKKLTLCLALFLCRIMCVTVYAQSESQKYNIDSTLYQYYTKCKAAISDEVVLRMSDTLFDMSGALGDERMQAVAYSTQLDYFYYKGGPTDSIDFYVDKVKRFSKTTKQNKYYYFAWSERKIKYEMRKGNYNTALLEVQNMQKEAEADEYLQGIYKCYSTLSDIYSLKNYKKLSFEYKLKAYDLSEKYNLNDYNSYQQYYTLASLYRELEGNKEKDDYFMAKAVAEADSPHKILLVNLELCKKYAFYNQKDKMENELESCRKNLKSRVDSIFYYDCMSVCYKSQGDIKKAIDSEKRLLKLRIDNNDYVFAQNIYRNLGENSYSINEYKTACEYFLEYIQHNDSINNANEESSIASFASKLNLEKLKREKNELLLKNQIDDIKYKKIIITILVILIISLILFTLREHILNRRLIQSKIKLTNKNKELELAQIKLAAAKEDVERAGRIKSNFIQSICHELRTPLNSINGFSQLLFDEDLETEVKKNFQKLITENTYSLTGMIDNLIYTANLDSENSQLAISEVNVHTLCNELVDQLQAYQGKDSIKYSVETLTPDCVIKTNSSHLSNLIKNLLDNANKFTEKGFIKIIINKDQTEKTLTISICDSGIGIASDKLDSIFEKFIKLDQFAPGTGLGLYISSTIAKRLNGSVSVTSSLGIGSEFTVKLAIQD